MTAPPPPTAGSPDAADPLAAWYDAHAAALFRTAETILRDRHGAEDAVHDLFVKLVRTGIRPHRIARPRAYLLTALKRDLARHITRRERSRAVAMNQDALPSAGAATTRDEAIERALDRLPPAQREVVALKLDGELTFAEIAAALGVSPNTAASRYRYALSRLREALARRTP